jgi:hypothetical protein
MSVGEELSLEESNTLADKSTPGEHKMQEAETLETVSLIRGGALYRFQEMAHLIRPDQWNVGRRVFIAVLVGWVPLVALTAVSGSHAC